MILELVKVIQGVKVACIQMDFWCSSEYLYYFKLVEFLLNIEINIVKLDT